MGASLTLFLTDGALLGLCSAWAVSSFLPVPRLGLVNPQGYIAFSLFPHLSVIPRIAIINVPADVIAASILAFMIRTSYLLRE